MRSLRTTLLSGLLVIGALVIGGLSTVVYARSHRIAHDSLREELRFRAETLAGLLEIEENGLDFEVPPDMLEAFKKKDSGSYMEIYGPDGKLLVQSPNLWSGQKPDRVARLPAPGPWSGGEAGFDDDAEGPDGFSCASITHSFLARASASRKAREAGWTPPPEEERRFRIQVALDNRPRDAGLRELAVFLTMAGFTALLITLGAGLWLSRRVLDPLGRMTAEAASLTPEDSGRRLHEETVVRELHQLAGTLNSALDRLGAALTRQREFTSDASHELRTPVSVMLANAEHLLRRPRTPEEYREGLRRQQRIAERMKDITENLLTLARGDATAAEIERTPLRLEEIAVSVSEEFRAYAAGKGVRIDFEGGDEVLILGDARYLNQLLGNLLSNAVKFTPSGGRVLVRTSAVDGRATLEVADTGEGIAEEHLGRIFDRFYRVRESRDDAEGAGLGLAIVDWIVRAHEADMKVESRPGEGTRFKIVFESLRPGSPARVVPGAPVPAGA